jgi:uncharacterized coiled-coil DUF342 family protein
LQTQFDEVFAQKRAAIRALSTASSSERDAAMNKLRKLDAEAHALRDQTKAVLVQAGVIRRARNRITYSSLLFFNRCRTELSDYSSQ